MIWLMMSEKYGILADFTMKEQIKDGKLNATRC